MKKIENIDTSDGPVDKRVIWLIDENGLSIVCSLWGRSVSLNIKNKITFYFYLQF